MGNRFILLACVIAIAFSSVIDFPNGLIAVGFTTLVSVIAIFAFRNYADDKEFITTVFLVGLALRISFGALIHVFDLRTFFWGRRHGI